MHQVREVLAKLTNTTNVNSDLLDKHLGLHTIIDVNLTTKPNRNGK